MKEVIVLVGPPGCGRDEWVATNYPDAPCITLGNHWENHGELFELADLKKAYGKCLDDFRHLLKGKPERIIVNNTNLRVSHRQKYVQLAHADGYQVFLVVLPFDPEVQKEELLAQRPDIHQDVLDRTTTCDLAPGIYSVLPPKIM